MSFVVTPATAVDVERRAVRDLTTTHPAVQAAIGVATAAAVIAVVMQHRASPLLAAMLAATVTCYGLLSAIDIAEQRLPNRLTLPLAGASALAVLIGGVARSDLSAGFGAIGIGLGFAAVLLLLRFGMGDVKLALTVGTIAGWFGTGAVMTTAYVGAAAGAVAALALIAVHRRRDVSYSFGPFLAIGSVAGMLISAA